MKKAHMFTFLLLVVGGVNWLLVGLFQWDIGPLFGGMDNWVSRGIYILVGVAAIYEVVTHKANCSSCGVAKKSDNPSPAGPAV